ncbi:MAG: hypothetical protein ACJ72D_25910, partial [Marmoricola sp.]
MKTPQHRSRVGLLAGAALALSTAGLVVLPAGSASADNAGDQPFSGWVRNYSAYVGAELLNGAINARVNVGEAVTVADSTGLNKTGYTGTSTGDIAVPGGIATDPTSRSYARTAPVGVGFIGLNVQPMNTESYSTTVVDGVEETMANPLQQLNLSPIGKLSLLAGRSDTNWNNTVLTSGGMLAYADSSIGTLEILNGGIPGLPTLPFPIPGFSDLFPLGTAELGQNTSEVRLVGDTSICPTGLAVQSRASWDLADVHLFNGFIDVSWAGNAGGGTPDSAVMIAKANGLPAGAKVTAPELGDMTINIGTMSLTLKPGLSIELGKLLTDAGGLGSSLAGFVDGEISYEGVTDVHEAADGTWAHASLQGLTANLSLLPVPIIAPNGLGAAEVGVMHGDVDAVAPAGGLNCTAVATDPTGTPATGTPTTGTPATGTPDTGVTTTGTPDTGVTTTGTPVTGVTTTGTPDTGVTTTGTPVTGVTTTGTPDTGVTTTGTPVTGVTTTGTPDTGVTTTGTPVTGVTTTGTPATGVMETSTDTLGTTPTGTDSTGPGSTDATGTPVTGVTTTGTPVTGVTTTGTPDTGVTTTGTPVTGVMETSTDTLGTTPTGTDSTGPGSTDTTGTPATGT